MTRNSESVARERLQALCCIAAFVLCFSLSTTAAEELAPQEDSAKSPGVEIHGWGWTTLGRVIHSYYHYIDHNKMPYEGEWFGNLEAGIVTKASVGKRTTLKAHFGGAYGGIIASSIGTPVLPRNEMNPTATTAKKKFIPYLLEASSRTCFDISERFSLSMQWGYFPIKYNPQVQNLGEYLFRSGIYAPYITSGFEAADKAKVMGLRIGTDILRMIHIDLIMDSEIDEYPLYDLSLSYLFRVNPHPFVDFGAGVRFERLVPVDPDKTTPGRDTIYSSASAQQWQNYIHIDEENGDTTDYSFKGTIGMARLCLDLKAFFPTDIFGKEDLKLYTEVAVLGIKDYPLWYEEITERVPFMFGLNIPCFKVIDRLAVEAEWFGFPYVNSTRHRWDRRSPLPYIHSSISTRPEDDSYRNKTADNWKWSVYMNKLITPNMRVSTQIARDHIQRCACVGEDVCQRKMDWYWVSRVAFMF